MQRISQWFEEAVKDCVGCLAGQEGPRSEDWATTAWDEGEGLCEKHEELREALERAVSAHSEAALEIALAYETEPEDALRLLWKGGYEGTWRNGGEWAKHFCEEWGYIDEQFPSWIVVDWEETFQSLELDGDYWSKEGEDGMIHIFRNNY